VLVLVQRREDFVRMRDAHPIPTAVLLLAGVALLATAAVAVELTDQVRDLDPEELSRRRLFAAYAGGAAGIAGTAAFLIGSLLLTIHRVVPQRGGRDETPTDEVPVAPPADDVTVRLAEPEPPTVRLPAAEPPTVRLPAPDQPGGPR
jgi:hypothetical protein